MKFLLHLSFLACIGNTIYAQEDKSTVLHYLVIQGDTLYLAPALKAVNVLSRKFENTRDRALFERLKRNMKVVYPYMRMAEVVYADINGTLDSLEKKRFKKRYLKDTRKSLKERFFQELAGLKVSQGKLLVKLINRQTGNNCFELIKELKGPVAARWWQRIAKRHDYDLKEPYNPEDNEDVEFILRAMLEEEGEDPEVPQSIEEVLQN